MTRRLLLPLLVAFSLAAHAAPPMRPKLVVAVLVDQLRYDYLERFSDQFGEGGFRLLMDRGAFMTFARYDFMPTVTAPGHASFFSGTTPASHGIIGNDWYARRSGKMVYCVGDTSVSGVGTTTSAGQMSPRNFLGANFSDIMRMRFRSKVITISMKDRGAVLPGGRKPAGAYWWEAGSGNFITSSYYMAALPEWVRKFNTRQRAAQFIGQKWERLLDPSAYEREDLQAGEGNLAGETTPTFEHKVAASATEGFENIMPTPFGNQLLLEFALAALEGEKLGQGTQPDVFCISFSSLDYGGHRFGPDSQEAQDLVLRLDRQLAELLAGLHKQVGLDNLSVVLTSDHGVAPTPEFAQAQGLAARRVDTQPLMTELLQKLAERFGGSTVLLTPRIVDGNLYFNHAFLRDKGIAPNDVVTFIREWALGTGLFAACYSREQLLEGRAPGDMGERVRRGFHAERSGDAVLVYQPFTFPGQGQTGTTHGSPYSYDTHVPVIFFGPQFRAGRYADDFAISDIVPTLAAALRTEVPAGSIGRPAVKILADQPSATSNHPQ